MSTQLIVPERNHGFMDCQTLENAIRVSEIIASSSFCPTNMKGKPGDVLVCLQFGQELGLKPMASIQNIAVINGRPSIWGDAMLAVCQQSPDFEYIKEDFDVETMTAYCTVKRKGHPEHTMDFSKQKAIKANLWGKIGPWSQYQERMLQMRARGFGLRDKFAKELRGIIIKEEAEDYPTERINYSNVENAKPVEGITIEEYPKGYSVNDEQIMELVTLAKKLDANLKITCDYLGIESLDEMSVTQWQKVMRQFEKKLLEKDKEISVEQNISTDACMTDAAKEFFGESV
jgi:hypothetical protein